MSTELAPTNVSDYVKSLVRSNPDQAVAIALAEAEREKALAAKAKAEYQMLAEVEFDATGKIVKSTLGGLWRLAQFYAASQLVPEIYRGKAHDCFIACQMAQRMRIDPFAYMQASYVVYGKPGIEAKLAVAMLNTGGRIKGRLKYEEQRDDKGTMNACRAWAVDAETEEKVYGPWITWALVIAEGWKDKKGSKWMTMPEMMFRYRSATWFIRAYYPEVLMGMSTEDELWDTGKTEAVSDMKSRMANGMGTVHPAPPVVVGEDGEINAQLRIVGGAQAADEEQTKDDKQEPSEENHEQHQEEAATEQEQPKPEKTAPAKEQVPAPAKKGKKTEDAADGRLFGGGKRDEDPTR